MDRGDARMALHTRRYRAREGRRRWGGVASVLVAGLAALVVGALLAAGGCGSERTGESVTAEDAYPGTTGVYTTTTAAGMAKEDVASESSRSGAGSSMGSGGGSSGLGALGRAEQKIITDAFLQIEVDPGAFQSAFEQVRLLADRYGGYVVSADSSASGQEKVIRSGVIAIRVPASSLNQALADASALGKVTAQRVQSQDVTEEYVDLQARLKNAQAQEQALLSLMQQAKTVEETLRVRDVLSGVQQEIEQIKGRLNFLDEHSSYSTLTVSLFESGVVVSGGQGWGFVEALKQAARALVRTVNELIVFLGGALPVLMLLALIGWVVYVIVRAVVRKQNRRKAQAALAYHTQQAAYYAAQAATQTAAQAATRPADQVAGEAAQAAAQTGAGTAGASQGTPPGSASDKE